jgi:radical SAM superfamily enzyme YgiQ (UPF0313 family)
MKVLFIWTDAGTRLRPTSLHVGVAYLSATLKAAGHQTSLLRLYDFLSKDEFSRALDKETKPGLLAVSTMTSQFEYCKQLATWAKEKWPEVPVIFGGHHPTLAPEEVIAVPAIDMLCRGEGEDAMLELVRVLEASKDISNIRNLWVKKDGQVIKNEIRPLEKDLDEMPFMDLEIFHMEDLFKGCRMDVHFMAGRGCPYHCSYCCNPSVNRLYKGKGRVVRIRSVEKVLEELKYHIRNHPRIEYITFADETLTLRKKWVFEFFPRYKKEIGLPFSSSVRVNTLDEDVIRVMADAGCDLMRVGIESGSEWVRANVMRRRMSNEQIIKAFDLIEKYGIRAGAFAMLGLPHETPEMIEETIAILRRCRPNDLQFTVFYPLPDTELYEECKRKGFLTDERATSYFEPQLNLPTLTREQILSYHKSCCDEFMKTASDKESGGYFNFLTHLGEAEVESFDKKLVGPTVFVEEQPRRFVIQAHPPTKIVYHNIAVPADHVLDFDISMAPYTYDKEGGGVTFIIQIGRKVVFKHTLNPKRNAKDRGWHEFQVALKKFSGKTVDISFITTAADNRYCTAGWGRPLLLPKDASPFPKRYIVAAG